MPGYWSIVRHFRCWAWIPLKVFSKRQGHLSGRVMLQRGTAAEIPLSDASVDVTVSALVLNFVPNQHAALSEMARVTVDGGTIGAYVWDYAGKMDLMRFFWDAAVEIDPMRLRWTKE